MLAGRNKPVKVDIPDGGKGMLRDMMEDLSDEQWSAEKGKEIHVTPDFTVLLRKAMQMQPGRTRKHEEWDDALGHERPRPAVVPEVVAKKPAVSGASSRQPNGIIRQQLHGTSEPARPRRAGKKRSYNDNSFEGYGDGYVDDDGEMDRGVNSNSDDGSSGVGRKKRKKVGLVGKMSHYPKS